LRPSDQQAVEPDIGRESPTPPAFSAPLGVSWRNTAITFDMEKLEWCGYPTVKNFEDTFIHFDRIHNATDRLRMMAQAALA